MWPTLLETIQNAMLPKYEEQSSKIGQLEKKWAHYDEMYRSKNLIIQGVLEYPALEATQIGAVDC